MTELPCPPFTLAVEAGPGAVRLCLAGDLDYDSTEELVERAQACLAADPGLRDLFLDCSGLRLCDSTGVSGLLLIHRGTTSRGVALHLENAPAFLRRILDVTGTRQLFVLEGGGGQAEQAEEGPPPADARYQAVPPPAPSG
ncbi:STAS domain-containing protein [Streptomyces sp. NPDC060322]|uniref:STAS domain-containing protein n=1 Tax=unclassified Streptomyces TaxID=2593676 RepID=UPI00364FBEFF